MGKICYLVSLDYLVMVQRWTADEMFGILAEQLYAPGGAFDMRVLQNSLVYLGKKKFTTVCDENVLHFM